MISEINTLGPNIKPGKGNDQVQDTGCDTMYRPHRAKRQEHITHLGQEYCLLIQLFFLSVL